MLISFIPIHILTSINRGFSSSHRHIGCIGYQCCSLHNWLYLTIDFHRELETNNLLVIPSSFEIELFKKIIYLFILLYNIVLVLPYFDLNPPWVYMCSPSWTPFPPLSPSHPSGSSQCTSPEHPVSCTEPGLAIRFTYDNLHVSMPFSHIIPPSPSSRVQKTVQHICVSLAVSHTGLSLPSF